MVNDERNKYTSVKGSVCLFSGRAWTGRARWTQEGSILSHSLTSVRLQSPDPESIVVATKNEGKWAHLLDLIIVKKLKYKGLGRLLGQALGSPGDFTL